MSWKNVAVVAVVLAGVLLTGRMAMAATATGTLSVTANVVAACSVEPAALVFGAYDPLSTTPVVAQTNINVRCTSGTAYTVGLGDGANVNAGIRRMSDGTNFLSYELFQDAGRSSVWTNASTVAGVGAATTAVSHPVYGRIPVGQASPVGNYSDAVVITVTF